jgi:hypothetical protein
MAFDITKYLQQMNGTTAPMLTKKPIVAQQDPVVQNDITTGVGSTL